MAFLPPNSTAVLKPLDTSIFGTIKNSYSAWLMREALERENIPLEDCVEFLVHSKVSEKNFNGMLSESEIVIFRQNVSIIMNAFLMTVIPYNHFRS